VQFLFSLGPSPFNSLEKFSQPFASSIRRLIAQHDGMARDFDRAAPFKAPQSARDRLNSQAKIIRDVLATIGKTMRSSLGEARWTMSMRKKMIRSSTLLDSSRTRSCLRASSRVVSVRSRFATSRLDAANAVNGCFLITRTSALVIAWAATLCFSALSSPKASPAK
jgi:hypothetical protein